jgi:competence protein ComEC
MFKIKAIFKSRAKIFLLLNLIFIAGVFILGFRSSAYKLKISPQDLAFYNGQNINLKGRVCEEADVDYKSRRLTVCISGQVSGQVLVTLALYPEYDYGDFISLSGQLQTPPKIEGFDYENYLARYDIYSVMYYPKISLDKGTSSLSQRVYKTLINFKQNLAGMINSNLPEPEAGLANAILLGYKRTVMREDLLIFSRVGLSHMIAISGSHITILSAMIINFLLALGISRRRALLLVFIFLFLYPLVTGLSASAVRSAIMGGLALFAIYNQRNSSLVKALIFSAALMLALNPLLLRNDIGFQLSFLALLGIIYLYPIGEVWTRKFLEKFKLKKKKMNILKNILDTINLTLVSQIVILPIALINFKQLSIIAPLANVLVLWTFPPLLASLIIALFLTALIPGLGVLWFLIPYLILKFIFIISNLLAAPSWAAVVVNNFNWYLGAGYYLILIIVVCFLKRKKPENITVVGRRKK